MAPELKKIYNFQLMQKLDYDSPVIIKRLKEIDRSKSDAFSLAITLIQLALRYTKKEQFDLF